MAEQGPKLDQYISLCADGAEINNPGLIQINFAFINLGAGPVSIPMHPKDLSCYWDLGEELQQVSKGFRQSFARSLFLPGLALEKDKSFCPQLLSGRVFLSYLRALGTNAVHLMQSMSAPSKTKEWAAIELYLVKVLCWRLLLAAFGLADCPAVSFRFVYLCK